MYRLDAAKRKRRSAKESVAGHVIPLPKTGSQRPIDTVVHKGNEQTPGFPAQGVERGSLTALEGKVNAYLSRNEGEKAIECLEEARQRMPQSVEVLEILGSILMSNGRKKEAVDHFRTAIQPLTERDTVRLFVETMQEMDLTEESFDILEEICESDPQRSEVMLELGWQLEKINQPRRAKKWYLRSVEQTGYHGAYNQLGIVSNKLGQPSEALTHFQKCVELEPTFSEGWNNLALMLMELGHIDESLRLQQIIFSDPKDVPNLHSNLLMNLHYAPSLDRQAIFEEHKKWGQKYAPIVLARTSHHNRVDPDRRLRIGYISPDFKRMVVGSHMAVLLDAHNPETVELFGYGNVAQPDETTSVLESKFDHYRDIWDVSDEDVADMIEQDEIDILVELAGHTKHNRLLVLARKPAPIQVNYHLGYFDTTGMEAVDYALADRIVAPLELQKYYTEELLHLPQIYCYRPFEHATAINPLPAIQRGYVTFGAFTNVKRINDEVLETWCQILEHLDNARLILGFKGGQDAGCQSRFLSKFKGHGISPERIEIRGRTSFQMYMAQYHDVDIVLDTFPENGGTTTLDALWMGVPVVSLAGQHPVERAGLSILSDLGMESLCDTSRSDYVAKAVALAHDLDGLKDMRRSLRTCVEASPLYDSTRFAQEIESAYRQTWHRWCRSQGATVPKERRTATAPADRPIQTEGKPGPSAVKRPAAGRKDKMRVTVTADMPQRLIQANAAIAKGHMEQAKGLVNEQTIEEVRQKLREDPSRTDIMLMLATMLNWTGQKKKAYDWYERCAAVKPNALALNEMAMIHGSLWRPLECITTLRRAMEVDPDIPAIWVNLAVKLIETKQFEEGFDLLRRAIRTEPDNSVFHSILLFNLHHLPDIDAKTICEEHQQWGKAHAPISMARTSHANTPEPGRRLRIGYISPDFRGQSVMYFLEPILEGHNRQNVEVFGYANVGTPDHNTERLKGKLDHYRNICGVDDRTVARQIEQDRIDILVDLAGHMQGNRLLVLAHKPAPVQATYLGYGDTTGMEAVDYLLTDTLSIPPELGQFYMEQLMYIEGGHHCYRPPDKNIQVTPPPFLANGYVTFGSQTNPRRFHLELLRTWADILKKTPHSRMVIRFSQGLGHVNLDRFFNEFEACGVSRERIEMHGPKAHTEYLKEYGKIDILLDTFPENGGTYTCESLWMGVPVITRAGDRQVSRAGICILSRVGLEHLAATTASQYIEKAVALANDRNGLRVMRQTLRSQFTGSSQCNAAEFSRNLESTYRQMWHQWCRTQGVDC